jgi:hypothetical protein
MALIIHSPQKGAIALRIAEALSAWEAETLAIDAPPPLQRPRLIMPLLDEVLINTWEESHLGEWAMEAMEDEDIRLIPVLAEDCEWNESLFFGLPLLPHSRLPVTNPQLWSEAQAIAQIKTDLQKEFSPPPKMKKGGFKRAALRLMWHSIPARWKWTLGIVLAGLVLLALLLYVVF